MNTYRLESLMRLLLKDTFGEMLAVLQSLFKLSFYLIVKMRLADQPGEHWLVLTLEGNKKGRFLSLLPFRIILYHNLQLQHLLSLMCNRLCV